MIFHSLTSKKVATFLLSFIFSVVIVLASLYLPKTISSYNQLQAISCGWPMPFIQYESIKNPPNFPLTDSCIAWAGSPMDFEKKISWGTFVINTTIVFVVIAGGVLLLQKLYKNNKWKKK